MRWMAAGALLALMLGGCGGESRDAWQLMAALEEGGVVECESLSAAERGDYWRQRGEGLDEAVCPGVAVLLGEFNDSELARAVRSDSSSDVPTVVGDGWYVLVPEPERAARVADVLGGELLLP